VYFSRLWREYFGRLGLVYFIRLKPKARPRPRGKQKQRQNMKKLQLGGTEVALL
jgi:hypothetical protein